MKKKIRTLVAIMLIMVTTFGMNIEASAVTEPYNTTITRLADLPIYTHQVNGVEEFDCEAMGGIGIENSENSFFAVVADASELGGALYYYEDIADRSEEPKVLVLKDVGHANGMTVDGQYVYIAAKSELEGSPNINTVVRILISTIKNATEGTEISLEKENMEKMDVVTIKNGSYTKYTGKFSTITRYKEDGTFIVGRRILSVTDSKYYNGFTTATVIGNKFVVSSDPNDMFLVENNIQNKDSKKQDICYKEGYGLFIGRWNGGGSNTAEGYSQTKNVILWANIDIDINDAGRYTDNDTDITYRCYTPEKIRVYMNNHIELGVQMYEKFEIESMAITKNGNLIASFNVKYTSEYVTRYENANNQKTPPRDGLYKITKEGGGKFILS